MFERVATIAVFLAFAYAFAGLIFAALFVAFGVSKVDSQSRGSSLGFRLLILPGCAALWPLLALRWSRASGEPPEERNPHR